MNDPLRLPDERMLFQFSEASDLARWRTFQDSDSGGESTINLANNPDVPVPPSNVFAGLIETFVWASFLEQKFGAYM